LLDDLFDHRSEAAPDPCRELVGEMAGSNSPLAAAGQSQLAKWLVYCVEQESLDITCDWKQSGDDIVRPGTKQ